MHFKQWADEVEQLQQRLAAAEARVSQLERERKEAVTIARQCCEDADFVSDWPENLHLADVIEKRIYNLCRSWRGLLQEAVDRLDYDGDWFRTDSCTDWILRVEKAIGGRDERSGT